MNKRIKRLLHVILVWLLTAAVSLFAQPIPQSSQEPVQAQPGKTDDAQQPQQAAAAPKSSELPDAPAPARVVSAKAG